MLDSAVTDDVLRHFDVRVQIEVVFLQIGTQTDVVRGGTASTERGINEVRKIFALDLISHSYFLL